MRQGLSERQACRLIGIARASRRYEPRPDRNAELKKRLHEVARPGIGYRMAWAVVRGEFAPLNLKRVHRLWRQEGLSRRQRRYKKRRSGQTVPTKAEFFGHVWCLDFCFDHCLNGTKPKILVVKDEFTREWLHVEVATSITSRKVRQILSELFATYGAPKFIRSDNGPEFIARALSVWLPATGAEAKFIAPGSPWQNGHAESMVSRLRAELLDAEEFVNLADAQLRIGLFRRFYNEERPNSALGYQTPAAFGAQARAGGTGEDRAAHGAQARSVGRASPSLRPEPALTLQSGGT
jgi:transposase InsO family protein